MRLDFNVLWVEDQPNEVRAQIRSLEAKMAAEGFQLQPTICQTIDDVTTRISDNVFNDEIDLILVDWELGGGAHGNEAISVIRDAIPYKDIVFYSARTDTKTLRDLAHQEGIEGVYFTHRSELIEEVYGVFESLVKRALDLDHIRGIVMGATSDIDQLARECLSMANGLSDPEGQAQILSEMIELLDDKIPDLTKRVEKIKKGATVKSILETHLTFTANDGLRILVRVLGTAPFEKCKGYRDALNQYIKDVVPKRNILGHKVLSPEGRPVAIAGMPGESISIDELKNLRRLLLEMRDKFRALHGTMQT